MHNKKVLFIAPRFHTNQFFLTKQLLEKGVEVHFLSIYLGGSENHNYIIPIVSRPSIFIKGLLKKYTASNNHGRSILRKYHITSFRHCIEIYKKLKPEIVIIRNINNLFSLQHFIVALLFRKKIFLYTQHNYRGYLGVKRNFFLKFLKFLGIHHFTPVLGEPNQPYAPNTSYIPFVIDKMNTKKGVLLRMQQPGIKVITIGKMVERKKIKELIQILKEIPQFNISENEILVVSECISKDNFAYYENLKKEITKEGVLVKFYLNIPHQEVLSLLKASDLFILPSYDEQAAFSILEAMACGVGVICSDQNGTKCYIQEGVNGAVFTYSENLDHLKEILKSLLDKKTLVDYGMESLNQIEAHHGIENFYKTIIVDK
ncbi:glycosyltransferase family 4 protein [Arenibacter sp. GZD96]|uniref:glycosyltransferase family 4 protein n=1 Tax=Aurantibrevibacter litoralis TaxID=3106030 RepID=UPI002AFF0ACF|nr:glycosyltransferase family 4 protein [Arenibacter sp. GZD-96]MEA1787722.1 glycosyltransferase family 4 protein [Arenibacter sp. GZD-96]